ncbi:MAG: PTS sugar transporter subunit IIA [Syntrophus sp. SKADARSKE-3]|nr:PTS sugar transporter subunit IIA [Syntrophus sp. SKADARSKE-3]
MKITEMLKQQFIINELTSSTKRDTLRELSQIILHDHPEHDSEKVVKVLLEREKLGSTGIGDGIAIPHGKLSILDDLAVAFGRSPEGIDFNAMDGKPVHLFFLLLAPENSAGIHLRALAKISRMLKDADFRSKLLHAQSPEETYGIISDKDDSC